MKKACILVGKGGVGKTTIAAALALNFAKKGKTLAVSIDPAHNLGDVLDVKLTGSIKKIGKNLYALEIDVDELTRRYLERTVNRIKSMYSYLKVLNLDKYVDSFKYSPGIEEYSILEALIDLFSTDYDFLILDMPPTGLTVKVLSLPHTTLIWIEKLMRLRKNILDRRATIESITGKRCFVINGKKIEIPSSENKDPIMDELKQKKKKMEFVKNFLKSDKCSIILVMNPDTLSLFEGVRAIDTLKEFDMKISKIVLNKFVKNNDVTEKISQIGEVIKVPLLNHEPRGMDKLTKISEILNMF